MALVRLRQKGQKDRILSNDEWIVKVGRRQTNPILDLITNGRRKIYTLWPQMKKNVETWSFEHLITVLGDPDNYSRIEEYLGPPPHYI